MREREKKRPEPPHTNMRVHAHVGPPSGRHARSSTSCHFPNLWEMSKMPPEKLLALCNNRDPSRVPYKVSSVGQCLCPLK